MSEYLQLFKIYEVSVCVVCVCLCAKVHTFEHCDKNSVSQYYIVTSELFDFEGQKAIY